jgi:Fic-DOC domain mobile mystery protein B
VRLIYPPGATPLDPNEIEGLLPNIGLQSELNAREEDNILRARRWALSPRNRALKSGITSPENLCLLHEKMFEDVWRWAGQFRRTEKNIGVPWLQIATALFNLCEDVKTQVKHHSYTLDERAARFHHRLVQIHPFSNGNGRHARLATDIFLTSCGSPEFSWGERTFHDPLVVRSRYIESLRAADKGDLTLLMTFVRS